MGKIILSAFADEYDHNPNIHASFLKDNGVGYIEPRFVNGENITISGEEKVKEYKKQLTIGVLGRLVFSPLLMVSAGILLGFRNELLIPLLIMSGSPTAVSSFTMAQQMDGDGELAAGLVVFTSALAILSMFLWIFVLKQTGMI